MNDRRKTKAQLIEELKDARERIGALDAQLESLQTQIYAASASPDAAKRADQGTVHEAVPAYRSEPSFFAFAEKTHDIVYRYRADPPRYEYLSPSVERVTGYTRDDVYADPELLRQLLKPEEHPRYGRPGNEPAVPRVCECVHKDGHTIWLEEQAVAIRGPSGGIIAIEGVVRDVSARVKAERAAREQEALLRALVDNLPFDFWAMDAEGWYIMQNATNKRNWGDLIGCQIEHQRVSPEMRRLWREQDEKALAGNIVEVEYEFVRDGAKRIAHKTKAPVRTGDRITGIVCAAFDVTESRRVERALDHSNAILQTVGFASETFLRSGPWEQDLEQVIERLGHATAVDIACVFENRREPGGDGLVAMPHSCWTAPACRPAISGCGCSIRAGELRCWEEMLRAGETIHGHGGDFAEEEERLLEARHIRFIVIAPIFAGPHWWGFMSFCNVRQERDWSAAEIDALKAAASILGAAIQRNLSERELLEASAREQRRIGRDLHDDLGQQLTAVLCLTQGLANELGGSAASQAAGITDLVKEAIGQTKHLVRGLCPVGVESGGLVAALKEMAAATEELFKISCRVSCAECVAVHEDAVAEHVFRIAREATRNAAEHGKATEISIALTSEGCENTLTVEDNGEGIPEDLDRHKGMGLRIMGHRAKIVGGRLEIRRRKGRGTIVTCTFTQA